MPRGRHRHSPPLHRMLPPLTVAGGAAAFAAASLLTGDTAVLRVLTAATALTACAGAALARTWDRSAGREVADLTAARVREEWRTDERIAELETDLEEFRDIRGRLEKKLRSKRAELARMRTEHADLLRRYATAEAERARALEARRRLQLEGTQRQFALSAGPAPVGPAAFLKADQALRDLSRNAAKQRERRAAEDLRHRGAMAPVPATAPGSGWPAAPAPAPAPDQRGRHAALPAGHPVSPAGLPVREHRLVPAVAAAVLPYAQRPSGHRAVGGFDFFGTQKAAALPPAPPATEVAPPVTKEDGAASPQESTPEHAQAAEPPAEVIDLTAHDDTEQLDVSELRGAKA